MVARGDEIPSPPPPPQRLCTVPPAIIVFMLALLQVFLVKKRTGPDVGKICAMKVLKKVSPFGQAKGAWSVFFISPFHILHLTYSIESAVSALHYQL